MQRLFAVNPEIDLTLDFTSAYMQSQSDMIQVRFEEEEEEEETILNADSKIQ